MTKKICNADLTKDLSLPQFEVLKYLQEGLNLTQIGKRRHVSRQSVKDVLTTLCNKAYISNPKRRVYNLTNKGFEALHKFVALRYKLRQHNLHFKIEILESPKNWEQKRNEMRLLPYHNKIIKLKNNEQDLFNFGRLQVKTTTKSIIIKMPTLYAKNWEEAIIQAMQILEDKIYQLENIFKIRLVKNFKSNIKVISQEYASIQDSLAKLYRTEGNRIYLTGDDGKIWLITDFSFSTDELEYIHTEKATDDQDAIAPMLNDLRKNPTTFTEVKEEMKDIQGVLKGVIQNEVKHQKVLDEILLAFNKWNKKQDEILKRLESGGL